MRTLVAYLSSSGNTLRVAEAIHAALPDSRMMAMTDVGALDGYDLIFAGFPVTAEGAPRKARRFLGRARGRKVALFLTHGMPASMEEFRGVVPNCRRAAAGCELLGEFECQGNMVPWMPKLLRLYPRGYVRRWARMNGEAHGAGHPSEEDLDRARAFATEVRGRLTVA
ncbi:MAG: flavodoxin [Methanomassiliicoccales archaeon PtaB.Bin134]|nr:MAG: flavodoxin [Methanomassiliicoccales archaeon PtaB.Bin134]